MDYEVLKSGGFIKQVQKDLFTVRLRCPGGRLTSDQLRKAAEMAEKYGRGEVHATVRQSIEVPYVHHQDIEAIVAELKDLQWSVASCGPRIRVPTACAGCTWNPHGLTDCQSMAMTVDRQFFGMLTGHHKFKISFSGCPIDCARTRGMDLGFQGMVDPEVVAESCNGCGLCITACEERALILEDGLPTKDANRCIYCGDCIKVCPLDAMVAARVGWLVRVGGKNGRHPLHPYEVAQFATDEQCLALVERTVGWYRDNALGRERIGATVARLGLAKYIDEVARPLLPEILDRTEERRKYKARGNLYI